MCPAKSEHQQKFMGMVHALQKGELSPDEVSAEVRKAAASMKKSDAKDYASTKHKGIPAKVKKEAKAVSKAQQKYMGMVHALKQGDITTADLKGKYKEKIPSTSDTITADDADEFASTDQEGLPAKAPKKKEKEKEKTEESIQMNEGEDKALAKQGLAYAKKKYKYNASDLKRLAKELLTFMRSGEIDDQGSMEGYIDYRHDSSWDESVEENTLTDLPTDIGWGYTKDGVVQCVASKNTCITRMKADRERNPGRKYQLIYAPDLVVGEEYDPIKEAIRPIVREMLKEVATQMQCNECGKEFKKKLGPKTYEVKCPKCGSYDTEIN